MSKLESLKTLAASCKACMRCDLGKTRTNVVFGSGSPDAQILVIGEGPGENEDQTGIPFVGLSGKLLTKLFTEAGLSRETDLFITNTVKCRPPGNRDPLPTEIQVCNEWLQNQITVLSPKIIVLVGRVAAQHYLGRDVKITQERGKWLSSEPYVMTILHPSYLLRNQGADNPAMLNTIEDLKTIKNLYASLKPSTTSFWSSLQEL